MTITVTTSIYILHATIPSRNTEKIDEKVEEKYQPQIP